MVQYLWPKREEEDTDNIGDLMMSSGLHQDCAQQMYQTLFVALQGDMLQVI